MSVAGAIYGLGGGILIKPVLDSILDVSTVSFLPGCTTLSMSAISVGKKLCGGNSHISRQTPALGIGAVGGALGKYLFQNIARETGRYSTAGFLSDNTSISYDCYFGIYDI